MCLKTTLIDFFYSLHFHFFCIREDKTEALSSLLISLCCLLGFSFATSYCSQTRLYDISPVSMVLNGDVPQNCEKPKVFRLQNLKKFDITDISKWRDMYFLLLIVQWISGILGNEDWLIHFGKGTKMVKDKCAKLERLMCWGPLHLCKPKSPSPLTDLLGASLLTASN